MPVTVKTKFVFNSTHVNAGSWADVMVIRRVGTLLVPNLVVLGKLLRKLEMQATLLKLEDGSKGLVCDFLVMDVNAEMLGNTLRVKARTKRQQPDFGPLGFAPPRVAIPRLV